MLQCGGKGIASIPTLKTCTLWSYIHLDYLASILLTEREPTVLVFRQVSLELDGILVILRPEASITTFEDVDSGVRRPSCFLVCVDLFLVRIPPTGCLACVATHCLLPCRVLDSWPEASVWGGCIARSRGSSEPGRRVSMPLGGTHTLFFDLAGLALIAVEPFKRSCLVV